LKIAGLEDNIKINLREVYYGCGLEKRSKLKLREVCCGGGRRMKMPFDLVHWQAYEA
jgi:hypothetical protein